MESEKWGGEGAEKEMVDQAEKKLDKGVEGGRPFLAAVTCCEGTHTKTSAGCPACECALCLHIVNTKQTEWGPTCAVYRCREHESALQNGDIEACTVCNKSTVISYSFLIVRFVGREMNVMTDVPTDEETFNS